MSESDVHRNAVVRHSRIREQEVFLAVKEASQNRADTAQADGRSLGATNTEGSTGRRGVNKMFEPGKPRLSIITATHNAARCLPELARSIRQQTYGNVEWIVVDGASTDGTQEILRQNHDVVDHWISEPDRGIYDAWNKGLRLASGEWVCFLGADDFLWRADVLEMLAPMLAKAYPTCRVVYGELAVLNSEGKVLYTLGDPWTSVRRRFKSVMALPHPGLMHHRSLFDQNGEFDRSYRIAGDYEFLLRELRSGEARFLDGIIVAGMTLGGVSTTPAASWTMLKEMRRATRTAGRLLPGLPWLNAAVRYALRRLLWMVFGERMARMMLDGGRRLLGKPAHWTRL